MRILWVVVDALGIDRVTPERMPNLCELGATGWSGAGRGVLPATTYPNHATFVTGTGPAAHGLYANEVLVDSGWVPACRVGPAVPTVFDRLGRLDVATAAAFGDHNLVGVCGAGAATRHWPPDGVAPQGVELGPTGYSADAATLRAAQALEVHEASFAMVHLDEYDGVSHVYGPSSAEAARHAASVDSALAELLEPYRSVWSDTVVVVLSDHDQEPAGAARGEEFEAACRGAFAAEGTTADAAWYADGTCAVVTAPEESSDQVARQLASMDVVEEVTRSAPGVLCVSGAPGVLLGPDWGQRGDHGARRCSTQVAVLGGGAPAVAAVARGLGAGPVDSRRWAGITLELLGASA